MQIDLNDPLQFTLSNIALLLGSKDDSEHRQIRVTREGIAFLADEVGNVNTDELAFRMETFSAGTAYVGYEASQDPNWVQRVYNCLGKNWPTPDSTYIDLF